MMRARLVAAMVALVSAPCAVAGCGGGDDVTYFVGAVTSVGPDNGKPGGDAVIGVSSKPGVAKLYVCGGDQSYKDTTRWLDGVLDNDRGSFATTDGWSAKVSRVGSRLSGSVQTPDGRMLTFEAAGAAEGTIAGLYGVLDGGCMTGVVVRQDSASDQPAAQGVWCASDGTVAQVVPVTPLVRSNSGLAVRVDVAGTQRELTVSLVNP